MARKRFFLTVIFLIFIITGFGCKGDSPESISDSIDLTYQTGPNIFPNDFVEIRITNQTNFCIVFPVDFDIKVYLKQSENWLQVSNLVTDIGDRPVILEPKGEMFSVAIVLIKPDISNITIKEPIESYGLITGHLCDNENIVIEKKLPFLITPVE